MVFPGSRLAIFLHSALESPVRNMAFRTGESEFESDPWVIPHPLEVSLAPAKVCVGSVGRQAMPTVDLLAGMATGLLSFRIAKS